MFNDHFTIYYDGNCFLCRTSMTLIAMADIMKRIRFVPYQNLNEMPSGCQLEQFELEVHMVDSKNNYFSGFNAVRKLITTLIPLIPLSPLIWIPGVDKMGNKIYRFIANNRKKFCCRSC